ncbi:hypothetical protein TNCV_1962621 [Trichonephila clavipes]|nr:hypothetical protein TNCV_1962621 [Trichonephila clavipes]
MGSRTSPLSLVVSFVLTKKYAPYGRFLKGGFGNAICDRGSQAVKSLYSLLEHNCIHSTVRQVEHGICQELFSEIGHFLKQKRADTEARTFQYTVCEQSFPEKERKWHIRTNPGEKSIQCDISKQTFNNTSTLTPQMHIHFRKKPLQCSLCGMTFFQKVQLAMHMRTHTGKNLSSVLFVSKGTQINEILISIYAKPQQTKAFSVICGSGNIILDSNNHTGHRSNLSTLSNLNRDEESLCTLFIGIEAILNSRPLVYEEEKDDKSAALTPAHFLTGQN